MVKIRFRNFQEDVDDLGRLWFKELIELATNDKVEIVQSSKMEVDLEITGPYNSESDSFQTPFIKRLKRLAYITVSNGRHLAYKDLAAGIQPLKTAKKNIWFTGENTRPPQGNWDLYMSFDSNLGERVFYMPLWIMTCTNLLGASSRTHWNQKIPKIETLLEPRSLSKINRKFCCSFIGKTYPMRLHAIEKLSSVSPIDVFGTSVRNVKKFPDKIARKYKFCLCFENDVYPGYVTEKPFVSYFAGTVPLYHGLDKEKFLNPKAIINLLDFKSLIEFTNYVKEVNNDFDMYKYHFEQPLLLKKPSLNSIISKISEILK